MEAVDMLNQVIVPAIFAIVGIALIVLIIRLVTTLKKVNTVVDEVNEQLKPALANVQTMTDDLKPTIAKLDPLVERVSLTVDAANLELMRVDQILEDVNDISDTAASATAAIDSVTKAPAELVNRVSGKVRGALKTRKASDESMQLGAAKDAAAVAGDKLDAVLDSAERKSAAAVAAAEQRAQRNDAAAAARRSSSETTAAMAGKIAAAAADIAGVPEGVSDDAADGASKYYTYSNASAGTDEAASQGTDPQTTAPMNPVETEGDADTDTETVSEN